VVEVVVEEEAAVVVAEDVAWAVAAVAWVAVAEVWVAVVAWAELELVALVWVVLEERAALV
jgi:hypothetical protein